MKRPILTALLAFAFGIGLALLTASPSMAVHKGAGDLVCGQCHTMHSSQGGTSVSAMGGTTGSFILLRGSVASRTEIHNFCLQCHSQGGSQSNDNMQPFNIRAPKVHLTAPASITAAWGTLPTQPIGFDRVGSGGDFSFECGTNIPIAAGGCGDNTLAVSDAAPASHANNGTNGIALGKGHSLGSNSSVIPPGNQPAPASLSTGLALTGGLSCTSCHDPHGTNITTAGINKYRNLKGQGYIAAGAQNPYSFTPGPTGDLAVTYVGGIAGQGTGLNPGANNHTWPVWLTTASQNSYTASGAATDDNTVVQVPMSRFCAQCHGSWHEPVAANANNTVGNDWSRHPTQRRLVDGNPLSGGGISIVEFAHYSQSATPSAAPYTTTVATKLPAANNGGTAVYYADNSDDKVFCVSCHFSHGSKFNDILRWNYTSAVSGGSQNGNAIASNVGCQQCHNR